MICPGCGADVLLWPADGVEVLADLEAGVYEESNRPESVPMVSLSGHLTRGVRVLTPKGNRTGFRLHECGAPAERFVYLPDEEVEGLW